MTVSQVVLAMTYNIRIGIESSMEQVADAIIEAGTPDILALQEITVDWWMGERMDEPAYLSARLGLAHLAFAGALSDQAGGRFGIALLSRWPIVAEQIHWLWNDADEQRVLLEAAVRLDGGTTLRVFNTHLSHRPEIERFEQAKQVGAIIESAPGPILAFGDLNDAPDSRSVRAARGDLVDAFDACGDGPPESYRTGEGARLDYIWVRGILPKACRVLRHAIASDHHPVLAELWVSEA